MPTRLEMDKALLLSSLGPRSPTENRKEFNIPGQACYNTHLGFRCPTCAEEQRVNIWQRARIYRLTNIGCSH